MTQYIRFPNAATGNPSVGPTGAPPPPDATLIGVLNAGGNMVALQLSGSGGIVTSDTSDGPVAPGAVAATSTLVGVQFNTVLPTLANTQQAAIQADNHGRILVGSIATTVNTLDAADGPVAPGAVAANSALIGGQFNTVLPVLANTQQAAIQLDSSGRILVGSIASALPTGGNTIGAVTQASGPWTMNLTQVGGSAITLGQKLMAASLPVVLASDQTIITTADAADGPVAPGAVASKSMLVGVQFNTVLPTLANTQQAAIQADSNGRILVGSIASALPAGGNTIGAVTQASGPWTMNLTQVGGSAITLGQAAMAASVPVVLASNQTVISTSDAADGPVSPGAVATKSILTGVQFNTVLPTLANTQQAAIQADSNGRILVGSIASALPAGGNTIGAVTQASGPWTTNETQVGGAAITLGQKTMANSYPVVIASDQSAVQTKAPINTTGSGSAAAATVSTVITLTAPANTVGFILMCLDTSTANVRWAIGRTATTTLGQQLQPGRDTGFVPCGANVSLVAESGTQNYDIQWISQ